MIWEILAAIVGVVVLIYGIIAIVQSVFGWCEKHLTGILVAIISFIFVVLGCLALLLNEDGWESLGVVAMIAFFVVCIFLLRRGRKQ